MAKIDFHSNRHKLFSKVYYQIRDAKTRYVVIKGGSGSSKSYSAHQNEILDIMTRKEGHTLVLRKHGADLLDSCYELFNNLIDKYYLRPYFKSVYSTGKRRITFLPTGNSIILRGLDDSEKVKSMVGIKRVMMEEASEFVENDFLELTRRARGMPGIQFTQVLNPISENHWIKKLMCDDTAPYREKTTVLNFTYRDNVNGFGENFLTPEDIEELERLKLVNENQYNIYVLGLWGIDNKEGKFVWAFSNTQVKKGLKHDPDRITWASFDFNVNPVTCTIAQVFPEIETVRALECFKLENSDIWEMCKRVQAAYPFALWNVTGDATGQSRQAISKDNMTYYQIILQLLNLAPQQIKVPSVNPNIEDNQIFVNAVHKNWWVEIDEDKCSPLIYDLRYVEVNGKGEIIKDRTSTKKFADFLDNWRYFLNVAVKPHFNLR